MAWTALATSPITAEEFDLISFGGHQYVGIVPKTPAIARVYDYDGSWNQLGDMTTACNSWNAVSIAIVVISASEIYASVMCDSSAAGPPYTVILAKWNGAAWSRLDGDEVQTGSSAIAIIGCDTSDEVFWGYTANGEEIQYWNGSVTEDTSISSENCASGPGLSSIASYGGTLYAGGGVPGVVQTWTTGGGWATLPAITGTSTIGSPGDKGLRVIAPNNVWVLTKANDEVSMSNYTTSWAHDNVSSLVEHIGPVDYYDGKPYFLGENSSSAGLYRVIYKDGTWQVKDDDNIFGGAAIEAPVEANIRMSIDTSNDTAYIAYNDDTTNSVFIKYLLLGDPLLCWNYTARYKNSKRLFSLNGGGSFPSSLSVPSSVDKNTGKMIDEGQLIDPRKYKII